MSGNKARTAKALGITRKTLYSKLKEYDDLV
jgi:DNA-binding protein Fis